MKYRYVIIMTLLVGTWLQTNITPESELLLPF